MEKTKIDIISGFLGAGKTTLIKKLLKDAFQGEQVVLIENEFGEIGIDGGFLKEAGIQIREMNSGCICCSLVGDCGKSLHEVVDTYHPDRILIEIIERKPVGAVVTANGYIQVSADGRLLSIAPTIGQYNLPVISGVQLSEIPTPGNIIQNDNLTKALQIISESDQDLLNNLAELNVGQADSIMACTNEGIEIRLGDVDDIEIRLMDLNDILKDIVHNEE